ncbi:hypothetical protein CK203_011678 [Vitis vinifera]|uniref:Uncharacterized protein n=1 Tax=Vitis vinifera TaxID=29760 RepID=A0A438JUM4_VITVI|nr:hypothetical protein CK203_011678 [Vitis vinifera]
MHSNHPYHQELQGSQSDLPHRRSSTVPGTRQSGRADAGVPNFFLVNSKSLHMGRRFNPLTADEDLEFDNLYILFPMKRVNSVVTAADMAVYLLAANSAAKRISGGKVRILPESGGDGSEEVAVATAAVENEAGCSRLNLDEVEGFPVSEYKYRLAMFRSKKPLLETIREEPVCSR